MNWYVTRNYGPDIQLDAGLHVYFHNCDFWHSWRFTKEWAAIQLHFTLCGRMLWVHIPLGRLARTIVPMAYRR